MLTALIACEKEKPAEEAGKSIDKTAPNVSDEAGEVVESIGKKLGE